LSGKLFGGSIIACQRCPCDCAECTEAVYRPFEDSDIAHLCVSVVIYWKVVHMISYKPFVEFHLDAVGDEVQLIRFDFEVKRSKFKSETR